MFKKLIRIALTLVLFSFVFLAMDYYRGKNIPAMPVLQNSYKTLEDETVDVLALSFRQPVLLYFWASWCGPCKTVSPSIEWLSKNHQVLSIALDSGTDDDIRQYLKQAGYSFATLNDQNQFLGNAFGIQATPTVVILKDGKVQSFTMGISTPIGLWLRLKMA